MQSCGHSLIAAIAGLLNMMASASPRGPCDIYRAASTPCVAAHSTVRSLYAHYTGPLYTLRRASDNSTKDIHVKNGVGYADAAAQVSFCTVPKPTQCTVERIFDQSGRGNHLDRVIMAAGNPHGWPTTGVNAMRDELTVNGHAVFSAYFEGGQDNIPGTDSGTMGFRSNRVNGNASGVAVGDEPESMYMVTSGVRYNEGCCFDYGNSEVSNCGTVDTPPCGAPVGSAVAEEHARVESLENCNGCGKMEAIYWGAANNGREHSTTGDKHPGAGSGPWVMADLEMGVWGGNSAAMNAGNPTLNTSEFVTAMLKGKPRHFALKGGDAQKGPLKTLYDGPRPPGYDVMVKQGAIVLGIGGDNSDFGAGTFYEGAMTASYTTDATDAAVQANIVAARYGQ